MKETASNFVSALYSKYQQGITLVEMVITIVIIGIAMAAMIGSLSTGISRSATPLWEGKAMTLSQAYMDEILAMAFDGTQPLGGGTVAAPCAISSDGQTRENFNDVDDYNGLLDAPPVLRDSAIDMSEYANYQVDVTVTCAGTELGLTDHIAKRISLTITVPGGDSRTLSAYKGNF